MHTEIYNDQYPMPGSPYAVVHGCICPGGGRVKIGKNILVFEINDDCIIHGSSAKERRPIEREMEDV